MKRWPLFILANNKLLALPVNEYLNAVIIIQLSIKLVLLAAWRFFCLSKTSIKKKTPDDAGPAGSLVLLASGGTPKTRLASCFTTGSAAQRHRMGNSTLAHTCPGTQYPDDPNFFPSVNFNQTFYRFHLLRNTDTYWVYPGELVISKLKFAHLFFPAVTEIVQPR